MVINFVARIDDHEFVKSETQSLLVKLHPARREVEELSGVARRKAI